MLEELAKPLIKNKATGQLVEVNSSPFTVGRALGCDYVTDNKVVSRRHCKLTKTEQGWTLTDLSTNGTIINEGIHLHNGETSGPLKHKDMINIGEFWEFLSRVEHIEPLEKVRQEESTPSPGFDENGIPDEVLLNFAEQVEQQLENKPKTDKITNKLEEPCAKTNIDPSSLNIISKSEPQVKIGIDSIPSTSKTDTPLPSSSKNVLQEVVPIINVSINNNSIPGTSKTEPTDLVLDSNENSTADNLSVSEILPKLTIKPTEAVPSIINNLIPGTSKTESTNLVPESNENPAADNLSVSEILPKMTIEPTEACRSKDNENKRIKLVSVPSSLVSTPGGSLKIVKVQKVTPEQVNEWRKSGMIIPVTLKSPSVTSTISNLNTTVNKNQIIDLTNVPVVTVNSLSNLNFSNVSSPIPIVSIDSTTKGTNPTLNTSTIPVISTTGLNSIHSNKKGTNSTITTTTVPVILKSIPNSINLNIGLQNTSTKPVIDLSRSESESILLNNVPLVPQATHVNIPSLIPGPLLETDVPMPIQEVEVETNKEAMDACPVGAENKIHESQEAGPSKDVKNEQQNQFEEMEDELMCTICANLFIKTITLGCSHSFCQYCIETWKKKKSDCPICRNKITSTTRTLVLDNVIEKMVENGTEQLKQSRKQAVEEREKTEKEEKEQERKKKEAANERRNTARRGRNNRRGGGINRGTNQNQNNQRNNQPVQQAPPPPPPTAYINITDSPSPSPSPSTTEDEDSENGWEDEYEDDEWYNGRPGAYYGGYGRCYNCGERGHWANGCPYF